MGGELPFAAVVKWHELLSEGGHSRSVNLDEVIEMQGGGHATRANWIIDLARASIGASIILPSNAKAPG